MNALFNSTSKSKNDTGAKRSSLEAFKAKADAAVTTESIDKITGGAMCCCHCHKVP